MAPLVPQPMGVVNMANVAPLHLLPHILAFPNVGLPSGFPSTPGQPPVGHVLQSREYNVMSNSHPVLGERQINHIPQGGNINVNSHNSSLWSSGFTNALQDHSLDPSRTRQPSSHTESASKVSHSNTNNAFQQLFYVSRDIVENTYFLLNSFFDVAQIRNLEESHRLLDTQIDRLIPYVSQQTEDFNVHNMVQAM